MESYGELCSQKNTKYLGAKKKKKKILERAGLLLQRGYEWRKEEGQTIQDKRMCQSIKLEII